MQLNRPPGARQVEVVKPPEGLLAVLRPRLRLELPLALISVNGPNQITNCQFIIHNQGVPIVRQSRYHGGPWDRG